MSKRENIHNTSSYQQTVLIGVSVIVGMFGVFYLYTTNSVAVQGYAIRGAEQEIARLKQDNNQLRIQEAELKSLYRIEEAGKRLNMFEPTQVSYIEDTNPIALR